MVSGRSSISRNQVGAMVVRCTAGPLTAAWITRHELALVWRRSWGWLIAAGIVFAIAACCVLLYLIAWTGFLGTYYAWIPTMGALEVALVSYVGVIGIPTLLTILVAVSLQDAGRGSARVRRYADPGAELQLRYLSDGLLLTTAARSVAIHYHRIGRIHIREHTVAVTGEAGEWVLPRELFPMEALRYLARTTATRIR
ncbi:hypothetical protein [Nocardia sp. NPDC051750]|uniref:hypothetical protein n=1 Tax=Nocardia sp. NPDC051750 TaxID=3364325 RepID=UPI0037A79BBD